MKYRAIVRGCGGYLPERLVTNNDLSKIVDTNDEWLQQRTGIKQRYFASDTETTTDLATFAAESALQNAGLTSADLDMIAVATTTPELTFPATAVRVQAKLGMHHGFAFDVQAVCSGFVYALSIAATMIESGQVNRAMVIGADLFSRTLLDWEDRGTCVLFGDGAGAVILESAERQPNENRPRGVLATKLYSDGAHAAMLQTDGGVSSTVTVGKMHMEGREVFKHAVTKMADSLVTVMAMNDLQMADIDWVVPHQANLRIIEAIAKRLDISMDKVVATVVNHGNTSAASIPLALWVADRQGKLKQGDLIAMTALGAGLTWGAAAVRW